MSEIKWIDGSSAKPYRPYDYPEGYSKYEPVITLIDDLYGKKELGIWEEFKKKIPKELHRRRWIVGVATFSGEKGRIEIDVSNGDYMPLRTHNWILKNDKYVKNNVRSYRGY